MAVFASLLLGFAKWDVCGSIDRGFPLQWLDQRCILEDKRPVGVTHKIDFGALLVDTAFWCAIGIVASSSASLAVDIWRRAHR
jgi:hypothetical protein